jgi:glycosyltransferase involved in cell wall biosynthesis
VLDAVVFMAGPGDSGISGGDVHALRLVDRWRERGATVALLAPPRIARAHTAGAAAREVTPLRTSLDGRLGSLPLYTLAIMLRTLSALRQAPPARVAVASSHFVHDVIPAAWLGRRHGARVAVYAYHLVSQAGRAPGLRSAISILGERLSLAFLRRAADVVFIDNDETAQALRAAGFAEGRLRRTQNAYDPLGVLPEPAAAGSPSIVFVGRLVEVKGIDLVLDVAAELTRRDVAARVIVLGDGPERRRIEARVREEGLENVDIRGFVSEDEKWEALCSATLFISPSREEGWGIAVGEALLAGVPAVVFDLPAYVHFGDLAERVSINEPHALVERAVQIAADPEAAAALRDRVRAGRDMLPRWADVLDGELAALEAVV